MRATEIGGGIRDRAEVIELTEVIELKGWPGNTQMPQISGNRTAEERGANVVHPPNLAAPIAPFGRVASP
jgi:hypothetical protein